MAEGLLTNHVICRRCGKATRNKTHYCDECMPIFRAKQSRWQEYQKKVREEHGEHKRLYGSTYWKKLRKQVLDRDNWLCCECARQGKITPATDVDHIIPLSQGGGNSLNNLQSLCRKCHIRKTSQEDSKRH